MAIFRISGVWHVGWWNLITSVRLIQVGNNRNDHFRYLVGVRVRLIKFSFQVNKGNKFGDFGYCPLNRGCPLNAGLTVYRICSVFLNPTNTSEVLALKIQKSNNQTTRVSRKKRKVLGRGRLIISQFMFHQVSENHYNLLTDGLLVKNYTLTFFK